MRANPKRNPAAGKKPAARLPRRHPHIQKPRRTLSTQALRPRRLVKIPLQTGVPIFPVAIVSTETFTDCSPNTNDALRDAVPAAVAARPAAAAREVAHPNRRANHDRRSSSPPETKSPSASPAAPSSPAKPFRECSKRSCAIVRTRFAAKRLRRRSGCRPPPWPRTAFSQRRCAPSRRRRAVDDLLVVDLARVAPNPEMQKARRNPRKDSSAPPCADGSTTGWS